jgi:hypothetical protein
MGFKDLGYFNLAMLGKHGWRLITHPETLCSRVLKTKYFPEVEFMAATIPRSSSATWRAIIAGREALTCGLIKRIGSGLSVDVWTDRWIPETRTMIPSVQIGDAEQAAVDDINKVADLIDSENWTWKAEVIRRNFIAPEADAILNIPLRQGGGADFWAWGLEKSGVYTVKSAYRSLMMQNEHVALAEGTATGTSDSDTQLWSRLWKLKVVPKVRVFWWRVIRGILPVERTLQHRHIAELGRCKVCLSANEDLMHALVRCSHAENFWFEARAWLNIKLPALHPDTWTRDIICDERFSDDDRSKIVTVMWAIWSSRNNITHEKGGLDPVQTMLRTREALAVLDIPRHHAKILPGHGWRPPDEDWIKINTDAGVSLGNRKSGAGGVARNPSGFIGAWSKPYPGVTNPLIAEALALRDGVIFAKLRGFTRVLMETDCKEVVDFWESRTGSRAVIAPIIQEIEGLVSSFLSFDVSHVMRSANTPAHLCAKHACTLEVTSCWMNSPRSLSTTS